MDIGRQWADRLEIWSRQFEKHLCRRAAALELSLFTTMERLSAREAAGGPFVPAPVGTGWGRKWEYGWCRTRFTVPEELAGERLVLRLGIGPEMLVWVNGREAGSIDREHRYITLTRRAAAGEPFEILAECYAGHGPRLEGAGPVGYGEIPVPEPPEAQVTVGESFVGVWNETLFQAAMDYQALYSLVKRLPEKSLRAMRIVEGLKKFTLIADFELPEPALTDSAAQAAKVLRPLLECVNGSTAPEYTVFGQSHIDLAWLWPEEETVRKAARTYSNQLALMEEYPDYHFLLCEPPLLEYLKEGYPELYRRVRERALEGRFYPDGAMWIESDTNIPSGESLIRQLVWGRRWFKNELGAESRVAWMPDTFGFSGALPQIMRGCGVTYFATQKLLRQDPEADPFPYNLFWWEGIDGSRVLAHVYKKNNAVFEPGALVERWEQDRYQREGIDALMFPYGYGDGGGGPTREMVEAAERSRDLEGAPRCRMESPEGFFRRVEEQGTDNVYTGELYLAWHRGTYTAQAETKRGIRRAETALKIAEYHLARQVLSGTPLTAERREELDRLWRDLLFCQFHDVAAGAGIERVHREAVRRLREVEEGAGRLVREALGGPGAGTVAYNHLSWPRRYRGVEIPAQGWAEAPASAAWERRATVRPVEGGWELRNDHLICTVDPSGELTGLRRAGDGRAYLAGNGNRLLLYKDVNTCYDAWEIGSMYEQLPVPLEPGAEIEPLEDEDGAGLRVVRRFGGSVLRQQILLGHDARRLDFVTDLRWQERHKLLKVAFPVNVHVTEALEEIQFGYVKRPTHRSRQGDRDRYEVCCQRYAAVCDGGMGAAVLNDGKYGVSVHGGEIRLTLMRAPLMPDMNADRGEHRFTYSVYPFAGAFADSGTVRQAAELNEPVQLGPVRPAQAPEPVLLPDAPNVIVDTVKPADTAENAVLVRAYESMGMAVRTACTVSGRVRRVAETDMLEEQPRPAALEDGVFTADFGAFEIKTFLLYL